MHQSLLLKKIMTKAIKTNIIVSAVVSYFSLSSKFDSTDLESTYLGTADQHLRSRYTGWDCSPDKIARNDEKFLSSLSSWKTVPSLIYKTFIFLWTLVLKVEV